MADVDPAGSPIPEEVDAVVVGAGFSGLYMTWRLLSMGLAVRSFDAADAVGGVWNRNRYPGAQTDSPQESYQFTFDEDLLKEWSFSRRFPPQKEVLAYLNHVADRFDLRSHYTFATKVQDAEFDAADGRWTITTSAGHALKARYFITALGAVSEPVRPDIPGFDTFGGQILYTNRWPHDEVDLTGKRVGLIGTGSSGVQITPHLARMASHLTIFQRTPNYVVPTGNRDVTAADRCEMAENYADVRRRVRAHPAGFPFERRVGKLATTTPPEERQRIFEESWIRGGFSFLYEGFDDIEEDDHANALAAEFIRSKIREIVQDPATAAALLPTYHYGAKRPPTGDGYYQSFNEPHVDLVNLRSTPIEEITAGGLRTSAGEIPLDVLVVATGFDIGVGPYLQMSVRGRDGAVLSDHWQSGPKTYLGIAVSGFPNMFMIAGPHSPFANLPPGAEHEGGWVADAITYMRDNAIEYLDPTVDAEQAWTQHVREAAGEEFIADAITANSWLVGANIAGRDPVVTVYLGGHDAYADKLDEEAASNYGGFQRNSESGLPSSQRSA